jgi:outer membrane lipoprotein SlyB
MPFPVGSNARPRLLGVWTLGILLAGVAACASSYQPIVDMKGVDAERYQADLDECREYAEQVSPAGSAATGAGLGGLAGAGIGAAIGAVRGSPGTGAAVGAAGGGSAGLFGGGARGVEKQKRVIRNCLRGRGYRVLD